jgi:hypothetical protein
VLEAVVSVFVAATVWHRVLPRSCLKCRAFSIFSGLQTVNFAAHMAATDLYGCILAVFLSL